MRFQRGLVFKQTVEAAIEPVLAHLLVGKLQEIAQRRAPVPVFRNMQLARRFAEAGRNQHRCHLRPGNALPARGKKPFAKLFQPKPTPQRQCQIHIAELARALDAHGFQPHHRHVLVVAIVVEQWRLLGCADQRPRNSPRLEAALLVQFAKMGNRLLNHAPPDAHAAHQRPVTMDLAVLLACRVAQIHAANHNRLARFPKGPWSSLHAKSARPGRSSH